ncbi:MAG: NAD(P)-dependent glycerol-3-phosphate dehydrogenase [Deltaproteobacteria bacterium]|nr:NAD(P)-dependent glycerol-3-phosphate dehydrogenase [Deltaproteobacteria bacterium]
MTKVAVLGSGAFGTALAKVLADQGNATQLWTRRSELAEAINRTATNERYLPGIPLPAELRATTDLADALTGADLVLFVVPSHVTRQVAEQAKPHLPAAATICNATKGIENGSLMLMSEVMVDVLGAEAEPRLTYLSGPSFAREIATGVPTAVTVAGTATEAAERVQREFATAHLRMYYTKDVPGVEVGGAVKNVCAIAAGAIDGLGTGLNTGAALMTRGLAEIGRLAQAKGADPLTLAGLAGMGDLVLTCTGALSRNRTVGVELGKGRKLKDILESLGHVAEGVKTTKSAYELSQKLDVDMPLTNEVYQILYEDKPVKQAVMDLMTRPLKHEQQ